ncbi:unnamed protein product [Sphagnum balticum]
MKLRRDIKSLWQELELQSSMREHIFQPCRNYGSTDHSGQHTQNPMTVASAYKELGLSTDASIEDVKAAYRRLALKCHPDLQRKDGTEFLRISTAYQKILNKRLVNSVPGGTARSQSPYVRAYPGPVRFNQTAVTVWGLGLATGCVLFGAILLWGRMEIAHGSYAMKGPSRVVEPSPDAVKRERIAALLLQKSKRRQEDEK